MLSLIVAGGLATCPCRQPQELVLVFDATQSVAPYNALLRGVLTSLIQELRPDSTTRVALVTFGGGVANCAAYSDCSQVLTALTSSQPALTGALSGWEASDDSRRCTSCGIEMAEDVLENEMRADAGTSVLLVTNGPQTVAGCAASGLKP